MKPQIHSLVKGTFRAGIALKGIDGVFETIGGVLLWFIHPSATNAMVRILCQHELSSDSRDFIAIHLLRASETLLSGNRTFASLYLLSHGATKVVLVIAPWMNAMWAYPLTIFVFSIFGAYQIYWYSHTHSIAMLLLTIFDAGLIYLTWVEWREQEVLRAKRISA